MQKNNLKREKAFVVGVVLSGTSRTQIDEQLNELKFLADTAGADTLSTATQIRYKPDAATFIGKGKLARIITQAAELECDLIIFNDDISPTQIKNLQNIVGEELKSRGLLFVGLDVIGDYLTEINVTSPTCLREIEKGTSIDIGGKLIETIIHNIGVLRKNIWNTFCN